MVFYVSSKVFIIVIILYARSFLVSIKGFIQSTNHLC